MAEKTTVLSIAGSKIEAAIDLLGKAACTKDDAEILQKAKEFLEEAKAGVDEVYDRQMSDDDKE